MQWPSDAPFPHCASPLANAGLYSAGSGTQPTAHALALRSRIILSGVEGRTNITVAGELGLAKQTVGKWRARFIERRLDGLLDEPRPGGPRSITGADVERVVTLTLETEPEDATHWSMARPTGMSQSA